MGVIRAAHACPRRPGAVAAVTVALGTLLAATLVAMPAAVADHVDDGATSENREVVRLEGGDREGTAAAVARYTFDDPGHHTLDAGEPTHAILARRDVEFDALAAGFLAGCLGAPVLLTPSAPFTAGDGSRHDVHPETLDALDDLGVGTVVLLGEAAALSDDVADALEDEGYDVERVGGHFREDTAQAIAEYPGCGIGIVEGMRTAVLARSDVSADALSASGIAYDGGFPILLTGRTALSQQAADALDNLDIDLVLILGGPSAIGQSVQDDLHARGYTTHRLWGQLRDQTAISIATFAVDEMGWDLAEVGLARWDEPWDAMTSGPYAGAFRSPVLLTHSDAIGHSCGFIAGHHDDVERITVFGGPAAVSVAVATTAARCAPLPPDELVLSPQSRTRAIGETHVATATVTDERGQRVDARVRFERYRLAEGSGFPIVGPGAGYTLDQVAETTTTGGQATYQYRYPTNEADDEGAAETDDVIVACVVTEGDERENDEPFCADVEADAGPWATVEARADIPADDATVRWREEAEEDPGNGNGNGGGNGDGPDAGTYNGRVSQHDASGERIRVVAAEEAPDGSPTSPPGGDAWFSYADGTYQVNGSPTSKAGFACAVNLTLNPTGFAFDPRTNHQVGIGWNPGGTSAFSLWTAVNTFDCVTANPPG